jgi:hypothetical protein
MLNDAMDADTKHRIMDGHILFLNQEGLTESDDDVDDFDDYPAPSTPCPVCFGSQPADGMSGPCSAECYAAWTYVPDAREQMHDAGWAF